MTHSESNHADFDWKATLAVAVQAAEAAGSRLRNVLEKGTVVHSQAGKDVKTQADIEAEQVIRGTLQDTKIPVVGEELGSEVRWDSEEQVWIVDPLDGTANYLRGFPVHAVSIALWQGGQPKLGVIYDFLGRVLYTADNKGLLVNGSRRETSDIGEVSQAILATGFPTHRRYDHDSIHTFVDQVARFKKIRMIGSAATSLALVAAGVFDAYVEEDIMIWDVAAGLCLVHAAGGKISVRKKSADNRVDVIATNGRLCCEEIIQSESGSE